MGGEAAAALEELISGVRRETDFAEQFRSYSESEKQWKARMEFVLRHLPDSRDPRRPPGPAAVPLHGLGQPPFPGLQLQQRPFRQGDGNG